METISRAYNNNSMQSLYDNMTAMGGRLWGQAVSCLEQADVVLSIPRRLCVEYSGQSEGNCASYLSLLARTVAALPCLIGVSSVVKPFLLTRNRYARKREEINESSKKMDTKRQDIKKNKLFSKHSTTIAFVQERKAFVAECQTLQQDVGERMCMNPLSAINICSALVGTSVMAMPLVGVGAGIGLAVGLCAAKAASELGIKMMQNAQWRFLCDARSSAFEGTYELVPPKNEAPQRYGSLFITAFQTC